ncbi:MAG: hypothetical protein PHH54_05325 [Candidatus Nanoarchaeia archaeon]|nr:hypothetical protein [Candidatus Nanoarchaeia archaeon]MDD5741379.1 hypothetical protein [Candidatus Nanoarchaeia archaeon]
MGDEVRVCGAYSCGNCYDETEIFKNSNISKEKRMSLRGPYCSKSNSYVTNGAPCKFNLEPIKREGFWDDLPPLTPEIEKKMRKAEAEAEGLEMETENSEQLTTSASQVHPFGEWGKEPLHFP